jgi:type IV pilus assembly protein PilQ
MVLVCGCSTSRRPEPSARNIAPDLNRAEALFQQGRYADAIVACTEIGRKDPLTPGLAELQGRVLQRLAELRRKAVNARDKPSEAAALVDAERQALLPDTYRLTRHVVGENQPERSLPAEMEEMLRRPVSIDLKEADLGLIVDEIRAAEGINIIYDTTLGEGNPIDIKVVDTPMEEVLEYVGRNFNVTFSVGRNVIWVTRGTGAAGQPAFATRIYRLRKGLTGEELAGQPDTIGLMEAIQRFVPTVDGGDCAYNMKAHALLVKTTRENLALIEDLIAALDVRPPQVLIEARFISTGVNDLRELGVDWVLNSPIGITSGGRIINGSVVTSPETRIDASDPDNPTRIIGFRDFPVETRSYGVNLTYSGVLTDPQFQAIVHLLETSGKSRTLSVPRVTTINNHEAYIRVGWDFRFFENYAVESFEEVVGNPPNQTTVTRTRLVPSGPPTVEELGIELTATPSVGADLASIDLTLVPETSDHIGWDDFEVPNGPDQEPTVIRLPRFSRRRIETEVIVRSGETVVMGGLVSSLRDKTREGIQVLSRIPLIGQLFRRDSYSDDQENLIIFVTATLISDIGEELIPIGNPEPVDRGLGRVELGESLRSVRPPAAAVRGTTGAAPAETRVVEPAAAAAAPAAAPAPAPEVAPAPAPPGPAAAAPEAAPAAPAVPAQPVPPAAAPPPPPAAAPEAAAAPAP